MNCIIKTIIAIVIAVFLAGQVNALDWPLFRDSTCKPISNGYGQLQDYDGSPPFLHTGIDLMAPYGTPIYAVKSGYIKVIMTPSADTHWRIVIGDSAGTGWCDAYMYAHINPSTIPFSTGDWVEAGVYIGDVTWFHVQPGFDHLHFSQIRYGGTTEHWADNFGDWEYSGNPLDETDVINDPDPPVFTDALGSQRFAFRVNGTTDYFSEGEGLSGDVDVVCRVYDFMSDYSYAVNPHALEYKIDDEDWRTGFCFTGRIGDYDELYSIVNVIYANDATCDSKGDYDNRDYFFIVTNSDGDSVLEMTDTTGVWATGDYANGEHWVHIRARDRSGNVTFDSMSVVVANFFELAGTIGVDEHSPDPFGSLITIAASGQYDMADSNGEFSIPSVNAGNHQVVVSRRAYETHDTTMFFNEDRNLSLSLTRLYIVGDANEDGTINVGDAVHVINYVFKNGPAPLPYSAGDVNGDETINVGDAVFLINYVFKNGPPPEEIYPL
ncbi:MAG: peptidoglycan DD-metalloendopeptidase family protein [FCB group bacterium]|nr:peptidoglycan DD-metalloendopeptidase family protein [FCB group bacterium]